MTTASDTVVQLSRTEVEDWEARWLKAWNQHQIDDLVLMCVPGIVYNDPGQPAPARGRDEVRTFMESVFAAYPDLNIEVLSPCLMIDGTATVLSKYRLSATMTGPWAPANFAATGARMIFDGVDQWTFADGLLSEYRTYYDTIGVARQLGILPKAGSGAEKLMTQAQHVQARFQRRAAGMS